ncbi:MAG: TonB family protein [Blastocatellia bacterium]|nr:TonB family protein [Blastocatellia bacterium]
MKNRVLIFLIILFFTNKIFAQSGQEEEFLPRSKTYLKGCEIDINQYGSKTSSVTVDSNVVGAVDNAGKPAETTEKPVLDLKALKVAELQSIRKTDPVSSSRSGSTFQQVVETVKLEGKFEILSAYVPISDSYIRNLEQVIRSNIFPPLIARTIQKASTVAVTFVVRKDGKIEEIQKESSTGSIALDATAIGACRSSSPLPEVTVKDPNTTVVLKMRFTLTFNPSQP